MKWSSILAGLGLGACAHRPPEPLPPIHADPKSELRERIAKSPRPSVLFVGNSYSFALPHEFAREADARGKRVRTGHSTHGGWSLAQHASHEPTLRKIREGGWDVVVFQEFSQLPARPRRVREREMHPPLRHLVAEARQAGAVPVLYQTWGRRDGNPGTPGDDFHAMTARLRQGYHEAAQFIGGAVVAPVGDAWEEAFRNGKAEKLFDPDGSHPAPEGEKLTARVFADILLGGGGG
ncbi:MAG: SGNH/GDSL hydrolase family protein [Luteolibacter sp.]